MVKAIKEKIPLKITKKTKKPEWKFGLFLLCVIGCGTLHLCLPR